MLFGKSFQNFCLGKPKGEVVQKSNTLDPPYRVSRIFGVGPRYLARSCFIHNMLFLWKNFSRARVTRVHARDFGFSVFQKVPFLVPKKNFKIRFLPKYQKFQKNFYLKKSTFIFFLGPPKLGVCRNFCMPISGFSRVGPPLLKKGHLP